MKRSWLCLAILFGVLALARAGETPSVKLSADEAKLLKLINHERAQKKLAPLRPNALLVMAARAHSANMAKQEKMAHDLDGNTPFERIKAAGYRYRRAGENVAAGDVKMPVIVKKWMESEGHRANILSTSYTETGVGLARGKDGNTYYTQVFGMPFGKE